MSLVSRTSSDLFATLMSRRNPEEVALKFFQERANDSTNMNLQLTYLIFRCCGLSGVVDASRESVRDEDVTAIVNIVKGINPSSDDDTAKLMTIDKKYLDKALKFFESFLSHYWLAHPDADVPFFESLIFALSKVELLPTLAFLCSRILAKLVTSLLKNYDNLPDRQIGSFHDLVHGVMINSFAVRNRQLLKMSLVEFERWLFIRPEVIVDDNFLCYITWSLKDTPAVILIGLQILERLLSDRESLPKMFLKQCGLTFSIMDIEESDEIFASVCECCVKIQSKFRYALPNNFDQKLTEYLFAIQSKRSAAAADYWLALNYDADDQYQSIHNMISCIQSFPATCLKYLDYFTDSLIDKFPLLTRWNLLAKILADKCERKLNTEEKDVLLMIIVHAVEQSVTDKRPRRGRISTVEDRTSNDAAKTRQSVSSAFGPYLSYLFKVPDIDPGLLLKLLTFFDFHTMPVAVKEMLVNSCESSFEAVDVHMQRVILEILWTMKMNCDDAAISDMCFKTIVKLKRMFETRVEDAFDDFIEKPDDYLNTAKGKQLKDDFLALRIIHAVVPVEKSIAYDATIKLMKIDAPAQWNPTFMVVKEQCIIMSTLRVSRNLDEAPFRTGPTDDQSSSLSPSAKEAVLLSMYFGNHLRNVRGSRDGLVIFGCLCDLAALFKENDAVEIFQKIAVTEMCRFFVVALSQPDTENMNEHAMRKFLEMIGRDIMPMESAYHALSIHCNVDDVKYIRYLHHFLEEQCAKRGTDFMVDWMTRLWIRLYEEGGSKSSEEEERRQWQTYEKLRDLIYCVRSKIENFVHKCHIAGIDYAVSEAKCAEFARILSIFSSCLSASNRLLVLKYARAKDVNTPAMQAYIRSLKNKENLKAVVTASPGHGSSSGGASSRATSVDRDRLSAPAESPIASADQLNFFDDDDNDNLDDQSVAEGSSNENRSAPRSTSVNSLSNYSPVPRRLNGDDNLNENRFASRFSGSDDISLRNYSPIPRSEGGKNLNDRIEVDSNDDNNSYTSSPASSNTNRNDTNDYTG